ncbi:MAG: hypothetical protein KDD65_12295 [Bacteroidetes bacterium]|nr:hypothetical protein [Bacteroidota bacterium]
MPLRLLVYIVPNVLLALLSGCHQSGRVEPSGMAPQAPSPMEEHVRAHERIRPEHELVAGDTLRLSDVLEGEIEVYVPAFASTDSVDLLIHFHGPAFVVRQAAMHSAIPTIAAVVNLGSGSSAYERPLQKPGTLADIVSAVRTAAFGSAQSSAPVRRIVVTAFSAGYGAVRAILRDTESAELVDSVILMDGLHASYVPDGTRLAEGGSVDSVQMAPFIRFAARAAAGEKQLLITHSEVFPGTYCSTTETTDYLIRSVGLERRAVLRWGPGGMQQLSSTCEGGLEILGFAGNSAPDHVDHFHGFAAWLARTRSVAER